MKLTDLKDDEIECLLFFFLPLLLISLHAWAFVVFVISLIFHS